MTRDDKIIYESIQCWKNEGLTGAIITTFFLINNSRRIAMKLFANSERACRGLKGKDSQECIVKYKEEATKELIRALSNNRTKCGQTKNPGDCQNKIDDHIRKAEEKLSKYEERLQKF